MGSEDRTIEAMTLKAHENCVQKQTRGTFIYTHTENWLGRQRNPPSFRLHSFLRQVRRIRIRGFEAREASACVDARSDGVHVGCH